MNWDFLHRWWMPFLWLALSSFVTVSVAVYLQLGMTMHQGAELNLAYGHSWVLRDEFLESIIVYLLNLGCAIWLLDSDGTTRWAAFWALLAAAGRIVAPVMLVTLSDVAMPSGQHYFDWHTTRVVLWFGDFQMFAFGIMLWALFSHFQDQTAGVPANASHAEAAYG
jgi:hypothetical protein